MTVMRKMRENRGIPVYYISNLLNISDEEYKKLEEEISYNEGVLTRISGLYKVPKEVLLMKYIE